RQTQWVLPRRTSPRELLVPRDFATPLWSLCAWHTISPTQWTTTLGSTSEIMARQPTASASWRGSNRHLQILRAAEQGKYGVIAAIAYNIEQILGLVKAAEQACSPLIIQFFPWAITFSNGLLIRAAADAI